MDIKEYIENGVVESYVLGLASVEETAELEKLMHEHAEVRQAVNEFAGALEHNAFADTIDPPVELKGKIMSVLFEEENHKIVPLSPQPSVSENDDSYAPVVKLSFWRYLAAASVILLIVSAAFNVYFYSGYKSTKDKYQALLLNNSSMQASINIYRTSMEVMTDTAMKMVNMPGVKGHETSVAKIYWNKKTKDVYVMANHLPKAPQGRQYQVWAIVNGKPVSAGVINDYVAACRLENIPDAQAFAITLEKTGGNPTPTMDQMFVLGYV